MPFIFKKSRLSCNLLKLFHFLTAFNTKNGRILIADTTPLFHPFWAVQQDVFPQCIGHSYFSLSMNGFFYLKNRSGRLNVQTASVYTTI